MTKKFYIATHNKGKQKEFSALLQDSAFEFIFPEAEEGPEETACTFIENALLKARHGCQTTGLPTLADDAGLVIPTLNGAPGIYSARYAGTHGNHEANIDKVLADMQDVQNRSAYFYSVIVLVKTPDDPAPLIAEGRWHGEILTKRQGKYGFGYDPIFLCPEKNCSAAELDLDIKNSFSHRGKALQILKQKLQGLSL